MPVFCSKHLQERPSVLDDGIRNLLSAVPKVPCWDGTWAELQKSLYETAIKQSFDLWGASGYDTYINDATSKQADYTDPNEKASIAALSTITIKWNES
jgi:hypothetical protein